MASTIAKMTLSFGLVSIPIKITAAARGLRVGFNMLHKDCLGRINQKTVCPACEKEISRADTVKGFEYEKDRYLVITEADLKGLEPESTKTIEITAAVALAEVDPILFDASYYLEPEPAGRRGFKLLVTALEKEKKAAVAKVTMHGAEQVVIIRVYRGTLMFHTMFYADEVRAIPECNLDDVAVKPAELELARKLLAVHAETFDHKQYADEYRIGVEALIEAKRLQKPVPITKKATKAAAPPDIMDALAASIASQGKKKKRA